MAVLPPDPVFNLRCPEMGSVYSICFHHTDRLLAGTENGNVFLFDLQSNRSLLNFNIGTNPINSLHHTTDSLISQEKGGTVTLWSMSKNGYVRQRTIDGNHIGFCRTALFTHAGGGEQLLCYPSDEKTIGILHLNDTETPPQLLIPDDPQLPKLGNVTCIKPFECASQVFILAGYETGHFLTWDLSSGVIVDLLELEPDSMALDYDPITNRGIVGGASDKLTAITYQRQSMQLQRSSDIALKNSGIHSIRIRNDQKVFATGGWDGRIRIFSWKSLRPLAVLTEHKTGAIMDIAYSEAKIPMWNASIMAAAGINGQISLWDLYN